jgi:hypothetical protein
MTYSFSHDQQVTLALAPKFSGFLSFCGSFWIVMEVLTEPSKRANVYHRLLFGMSLWDVVISATILLGLGANGTTVGHLRGNHSFLD